MSDDKCNNYNNQSKLCWNPHCMRTICLKLLLWDIFSLPIPGHAGSMINANQCQINADQCWIKFVALTLSIAGHAQSMINAHQYQSMLDQNSDPKCGSIDWHYFLEFNGD